MILNKSRPTQVPPLNSLKWVLCLLMSIVIGLSIGCSPDIDIKELSDKNLVIRVINIDKQELDVKQTAKLTAELEYSGKDEELQYNWNADQGEIYNNGQYATYVAPEKAGTYVIEFEVSNGVIMAADAISVKVGDPNTTKETDAKPEPTPETKDSNNSEPNKPEQSAQ